MTTWIVEIVKPIKKNIILRDTEMEDEHEVREMCAREMPTYCIGSITRVLEIRHTILLSKMTGEYILVEKFGDDEQLKFRVSSLEEAETLQAQRAAALKQMVAAASDDARRLVEESIEIDNLEPDNVSLTRRLQ